MSDSNTDNPYLLGSYRPVTAELSSVSLDIIEGEVPKDLRGTLVRNGPNPRYTPRGRYHWFDGDGMLHAAAIRDGAIEYTNRWVHTDGFDREGAEQRALWTGLLESARDNPRGAPYKDTANTDVIYHAGELIALWYICGLPYRVDPATLETLGTASFGADAPRRMSAHAKTDDATGELLWFDYGPRPPYMSYGVVDRSGTLVHATDIDLPGPRLPHDMAFTRDYAVLMDLPVFHRPEAAKLGRWLVDFHRDVPARFGVLGRRAGGDTIRWFEAEPCYIYHVVNSWQDGDEVVMLACRTTDPTPEPDPADGIFGHAFANLRLRAHLHRWRFNMVTGECTEETVDDRSAEFPTTASSHQGIESHYSYHVTVPDTRTLEFDGIAKYDLRTGAADTHEFGPGRVGSEAPFAPSADREAEDDGYLVTFVHDQREDRSEIVILDARDVARGPIARAAVPQRVPAGFHACWVPA
jgi:carotenoid cleavage dioxygenase